MKTLLLLVGMIGCAAGILFAGQGLGYINWPASSFMISEIKWVYYESGIALVGVLLIVIALR
jgi:hypothetical protein